MSETKRFSMMWGKDEDGCIYVSPFEHLHGDWVRHGDYARLKAEVERMNQHDDDTCPHLVRTSLLEAENARLKADIKDLREDRIRMRDVTIEDIAVIARLKAKVERLELKSTNLYNAMKVKMEADEVVCKARAIILQKEANETVFNFVIKELQAEVERLRKAGDIIARIIAPPAHGPGEWDGEWDAWNNAKSGVLSNETPPNTPPPAF